MKLHVLDIPDDSAQTADWLARKLMGRDLGELINELRAVHASSAELSGLGTSGGEARLEELLGDQRNIVLDRGLGALSHQVIGRLLSEPELLPALQELVLTEGGSYWEQLAAGDSTVTPPPTPSLSPDLRPGELSAHTAWHRRPIVVALATAASLMLMFLGLESFRSLSPVPAPLGWNGNDALSESLSSRDYLDHLADTAQQWFDQKPADAQGLAKRIGQFRQGCSRLRLADHRPLNKADRDWLVDSCRAWAQDFDRYLAQVENGETPIRVRTEMDSTVRTLIKDLRKRAESS